MATKADAIRALWFTDVMPAPVRAHLGLPADPGPQAWVDRLAEELAARDEVSLAIACPCLDSFEPFVADRVTYHGVPLPAPPASRVGRVAADWRHRLTPPEELGRARELIETARPDVVHVHGTESAFGLVAAASGAAPCVTSLQGLLQQYQRVYFAGRTPGELARMAASPEFLKGRGALHGYLTMRTMAAREAEVMRRGRWFIGRTDWDRSSLAAVNPDATYFHCDEIMRREFYPVEWSPPAREAGPRLYSTSSSMIFKGTETLLEAAAVLVRTGLRDLVVRVAGVPPGSELDGLNRRLAHRLGVEGNVQWLGRLDAPGIVAELLAADAFVYPTHIDNSPNALVEAMLCGAPVAATYAGGVPSLLESGREGLLVPRGDPAALAGALRRLLDDRDLAVRLGRAARARALVRNDPHTIGDATLGIYRSVVAAAGPAVPHAPE